MTSLLDVLRLKNTERFRIEDGDSSRRAIAISFFGEGNGSKKIAVRFDAKNAISSIMIITTNWCIMNVLRKQIVPRSIKVEQRVYYVSVSFIVCSHTFKLTSTRLTSMRGL